jgi:hypothetical protein
MKRIQRNALIFMILLTLGGMLFFGLQVGFSVLLGGALATVNFRWMAAGVDRVLGQANQAGAGGTVFKYIARLVLIFVAFFAIIQSSFLSVLGALAGLSVFVLAGMLEAVLLLFRIDTGMQ